MLVKRKQLEDHKVRSERLHNFLGGKMNDIREGEAVVVKEALEAKGFKVVGVTEGASITTGWIMDRREAEEMEKEGVFVKKTGRLTLSDYMEQCEQFHRLLEEETRRIDTLETAIKMVEDNQETSQEQDI